MELLLQGAALGIVLTSMVGPIFAALVETSIERGRGHGVWVGAGIWTSDFAFIAVCLLAVIPFTARLDPVVEGKLYILAGVFFLLFGLWFIFKKTTVPTFTGSPTPRERATAFLKGFFINTLNPFTFLFWFGTAATLLNPSSGAESPLYFYIGVMAIVIMGDLLKVFLADRIRKKALAGRLLKLRWIAGLAFGIFGLWLIVAVLM